jgi:hypothetical protein
VKVTDVPAQTGPDGTAAMITLAGSNGLTIIVIAFEVAGLPVTQVALEVITTVITLPLASVEEVYDAFVAPAIMEAPFIHW